MSRITEIKCKNCAAPIDPNGAISSVITCAYCGSVFTLPKEDTEPEALDAIRTGNHELDVCRFDDAYESFKKAAQADPAEPEAYIGMAYATHKVQYIRDTVNNRLQPICHEVSDKVFTQDKNYKTAIKLATEKQRAEYERHGKDIDYIRKEFFKLENSGANYNCFICVKVTDDETKQRTKDYKTADDIYFYLRGKGYNPFFSEREIGNRTGADYEALILYALYKSECMLVVCGNESYLQTPWVKNEYTRFLKLVADEEKESDSVAIVFSGKAVERLPGRAGKLQGIDMQGVDPYGKIMSFVESHTPEAKKKRETEKAKKLAEEEARNREFDEFRKWRAAQEAAKAEEEARKQREAEEARTRREAEDEQRRRELDEQRKFLEEQRKLQEKAQRELEEKLNKLQSMSAQPAPAQPAPAAVSQADFMAMLEKAQAEKDRQRDENPTISNYNAAEFDLIHGGKTLNKYINIGKSEAVVPLGVEIIGSNAFRDMKKLKRVKLQDGVKKIELNAFHGCYALEEAVLPKGLTTIGDFAFFACKSLKEITVPDGCTHIGASAFYCCESLQKITLPEGLKILYSNTLPSSRIKEIHLPTTITECKDSSLKGRSGILYTLPLGTPIGVTERISKIFGGVHISYRGTPEELEAYKKQEEEKARLAAEAREKAREEAERKKEEDARKAAEDEEKRKIAAEKRQIAKEKRLEEENKLKEEQRAKERIDALNIQNGRVTKYTGYDSIINCIPDGVVGIGKNAFSKKDISAVKNVPDSVKEIGEGAFSNCINLSSVTMPDGVQIESSAFSACRTLTGFSGKPKTVGNYAFNGCKALKEIDLSDVSEVGYMAFYECKELTNVRIPLCGKVSGAAFAKCTKLESAIMDRVSVIDSGAFEECRSLKNIVFTNDISAIAERTFKGCYSLMNLNLPYKTVKIDKQAFADCKGLYRIGMQENLKFIGEEAFMDCISLTDVVIPNKVVEIGNKAFFRSGVEKIVIPDSVKSLGYDTFADCGALSECILPRGIIRIGNGMFSGCRSLKSIVIPPNVTEICPRAFYGCRLLTSVTMPKACKKFIKTAFGDERKHIKFTFTK